MGVVRQEGRRIAFPGSLTSFYAAPPAPRKGRSRLARPPDPLLRPNRHGTTVVKARRLSTPHAVSLLILRRLRRLRLSGFANQQPRSSGQPGTGFSPPDRVADRPTGC